ncbi:MAG: metallophosphoesterase, partial [Candidatus Sungbacteria bacterium]|nr:metallophosphoesterase [Candidatus Sungbacteria bacterium]
MISQKNFEKKVFGVLNKKFILLKNFSMVRWQVWLVGGVLAGGVVSLFLVANGQLTFDFGGAQTTSGNNAQPVSQKTTSSVTIIAAGDMVCGAENAAGAATGRACKQMETSDLVLAQNPDAVLVLGDTQYEKGQYQNYLDYYHPSWGRFKDKTYPAVGNHEYLTPDAQGYFDYFNGVGNFTGRAGDRDKGYYAFNLGNWRLYALNSDCAKVGGCGLDSPQVQWLKNDLAQNPKTCQAMYFHYTLWTSDGIRPGNGNPGPALGSLKNLFHTFYDAGGDLAIVGHSHVYERFAPQNIESKIDTAYGVRQITIGVGGKTLLRGNGLRADNSEVFDTSTFGVLKLKLRSNAYDWQFLPIPGGIFTDSGSTVCHAAPPPHDDQPDKPDLKTNNLTIDPNDVAIDINGTLVSGNSVTFTGTTFNKGIVNAVSGSRGRWCIDNTNCLNTTEGMLGEHGFGVITAFRAPIVSTSTIWIATAGQHTIHWCADVSKIVVESDEANNCSFRTFTVASPKMPDLTTQHTAIQINGALTKGSSIRFTSTAKNQGDGNAKSGSLGRWCVDNPDCLNTTAGRINEHEFGGFAVGVISNPRTSATWIATAGSHTIYWCADVSKIVVESDEANNCSSNTFTVAGAPYTQSSYSPQSIPAPAPSAQCPTGQSFGNPKSLG